MDQIERIGKMLGYTNNMLIELIGYQLDNVSHYWYVQHVEKRLATAIPLTWEQFQLDLIDRFLLPSVYEAKAWEFELLTQGNMTVAQYDAQFTWLSWYVRYLIPNEKKQVEKFVNGVRDYFFDRFVINKATTYQQALNHAIWMELHSREKREREPLPIVYLAMAPERVVVVLVATAVVVVLLPGCKQVYVGPAANSPCPRVTWFPWL